jgi:uncharacterized protein DUF899
MRPGNLNGVHVLAVDDDPDALTLVAELLEAAGHGQYRGIRRRRATVADAEPPQAFRRATPQNFELVSDKGPVRLSTLFNDKDTLRTYSMMYGPQRKTPCASCTSLLTGLSNLPFASDLSGEYTRAYVSPEDADLRGFSVFGRRDGSFVTSTPGR